MGDVGKMNASMNEDIPSCIFIHEWFTCVCMCVCLCFLKTSILFLLSLHASCVLAQLLLAS